MTRPPAYLLRRRAEADLADILERSGRQFGPAQRRRYAALILAAIRLVTEAPERPGSSDRSDLAQGLRSFPVRLAAKRQSAASHVLFYRWDEAGLRILRILHEAMDFAAHLSPTNDH